MNNVRSQNIVNLLLLHCSYENIRDWICVTDPYHREYGHTKLGLV